MKMLQLRAFGNTRACCCCCRNVLRDADQLHAEGAAFKFYNAEFKVDVYFAAPENLSSFANKPGDDMAEVYLKTQVGRREQTLTWGLGGALFTSFACCVCASTRSGVVSQQGSLDMMVELPGGHGLWTGQRSSCYCVLSGVPGC
jgi:hypothetical protein